MREGISQEIGRALRRIRQQRGLRLKDVRDASGGRFSPTAVAGYERAERAITLERFCNLCAVYGVAPERVLAQAMRAVEGRPETAVDLSKIEQLPPDEASLLGDLVTRVARRRGERPSDVVRLRAGDLEILATLTNRSPDELISEIGTPNGAP